MAKSRTYENFPVWMPLFANLVSILIYAAGALILAGYGAGLAILYVLYCAGAEFRVVKKSCINCYYYGKDCGMGKGRLCSLLFKKGDPAKFAQDTIGWTALLPDFLVPIFPLFGGIGLLIRDFSWQLAALVAALVLLSTVGTAFVRGSFACRYCKQRELGCPAEKFFSKR
jgi:hypothetical protein